MDNMLKCIQKTEYDILKELDRICKKHNITYYLGQGTLLGAAKYKGFIPWDDDIDLLISYEELNKLIEVFQNEANKQYLITNYRIEKNFPLSWSKIRNVNTLSRPKKYKNVPINWGVCIDLFPIYPLSNFKFIQSIEVFNYKLANKMLMAELTKYDADRGLFERILEKVPICMRHFYMKLITKLLTLHGNNSKYVWVTCKSGKIVERKTIFGEDKFLNFENELYRVPTDYNTYLIMNYGDYMKPLPKELQKGHELNLGEIEWILPNK